MTPDAMNQGLWLYTGLALVAGVIASRIGLIRRPGPAIAAALAAVWVPWLLGRDPATARTAIIGICALVISRYGLRHLITWATFGTLFALQVTQGVQANGWDFGKAALDALNRTVFVLAVAWLVWTAWQVIVSRGRYFTDRLAWAGERRKLQSRAEHRYATGRARRGIGRLAGRTRASITGRELPAPPRKPDAVDQLSQHDLFVLARRHRIRPAQHTTAELRDLVRQAQQRPPEPATARPHPPGPPPPTAPDALTVPASLYTPDDTGMPWPLFHWREPVLRRWWR